MQAASSSTNRQPSSLVWRIAAPSLAASAALLAIAGLAAVSLFVAQREADRALREINQANQVSNKFEKDLIEFRSDVLLSSANQEGPTIERLWMLRNTIGSNLVVVERFQVFDGAVIQELRRLYFVFDDALQRLQTDLAEERRHEIVNNLVENVLDASLLTIARKQREQANDAFNAAQLRSRNLTYWTGWTLLLLGAAGSGAGVLAGFGLARSLRRQLVELSVPIRTAAGSLDAVVGPVQVRGDGEVEDLEDSLNSLAGRVASVVERLQAAERESLRNDQLAALGQLAAGLAHELRNPLTAVRTLVEAARSRGAGAQLDGRDLEVVDEEISRLDSTLQSFLDYARPPEIKRRPVDVRDVIQRTVQLVNARAELQSVSLETKLPSEPLVVSADAEQLRQVLLNLLLNALDAVGGGGRLTVNAESDQSAEQIVMTIADTGPGIPASIRDKLFDPFVSSKPSGTGLGLTICRRIVENHGGTISADNAPTGGAVFTVRLPAS